MMRLCQDQKRIDEFYRYFIKLANQPEASLAYIVTLTKYYIQNNEKELAKYHLQRALEKGLDSTNYKQLLDLI